MRLSAAVQPGPGRDAQQHTALHQVETTHQQLLPGATRPLEPDGKRLVELDVDRTGGLAGRVVAEADERLGSRSGSETQTRLESSRARSSSTVSSCEPPSMTMCSCGVSRPATLSSASSRKRAEL